SASEALRASAPSKASESAAKRRIVASSPMLRASTSAGIARGPNRESALRAFQRQSSEDSGAIASSRSSEPCNLTDDQRAGVSWQAQAAPEAAGWPRRQRRARDGPR